MSDRAQQSDGDDVTLAADIARWSADARLAPLFAVRGGAILILDRAAQRVLGSHGDAVPVRAAIARPDGTVDPGLRLPQQVRSVGEPGTGPRLVRLRLDTRGIRRPITCLIMLVVSAKGETLLLLAPTEALPARRSAGERPPTKPAPVAEVVPQQTVPGPPVSKRFVWRSDENHLVTQLSGGSSEIAAHLLGKSWTTLGETGAILGPSLLEALGAHRTFRALSVVLRPSGTDQEIEVELSGTPSGRASQPFSGFSGFGVLRGIRTAQHDVAPVPVITADDSSLPSTNEGNDEVLTQTAGEEADVEAAVPATGDVATAASPNDTDAGASPDRQAGFTVDVAVDDEDVREERAPPQPNSDLSTHEHAAFREIARALGARFAGDDDAERTEPQRGGSVMAFPVSAPASVASSIDVAIVAALDRLPVGVLVHRGSAILYANGRFLGLTGYQDRETLQASGCVVQLLAELPPLRDGILPDTLVTMTTASGLPLSLLIERSRVDWDGSSAELLLARVAVQADHAREQIARGLLEARDTVRERDAQHLLDHIEQGVASLDVGGRILSLNASARAMLSSEAREVVGGRLADLFTADSEPAITACLEEARESGTGATCKATPRTGPQDGALRLRVAQLPATATARFCVTLSEPASLPSAGTPSLEPERRFRTDFAAIVSDQIRAPIVRIADRTEILLSEPFGQPGSGRSSDYLHEIHHSSQHVVGVIDDLLDLVRIEAGRDALTFTDIALNDVVSGCIALMQPQAARDRIVVRTSLSPNLRPLVADERSMRQATLNVIANAIRLTEAGGQVIVSTTDERGEIAFRVRDTGVGMTQEEIERALMASGSGDILGGRASIGLGLTVTKALVEANRGRFRISSRKNEGTLVEMLFPLLQARSA
ncbi:sensor histidine kinase [Methylobacterium gnaphalii]|uniref:histidine kinase n=1 Tax=Methylobacterium gnaphalii TaxID=1010610 RepID=A0A512JKQ9_9HYPH|nr:ATP-binding protein [Methylobacterium gnaphalii]GEP10548.1 hypothetical protein MGN01_23930 [Methylobacterium gnaphalii]GJD69225.1 Cell-division control histidine kinase PdhS [Methylobacterium gnaphalii]GLS47888.1 hypothetical protein GCM10007885_07320 [Methylobacterium gnaphalii]